MSTLIYKHDDKNNIAWIRKCLRESGVDLTHIKDQHVRQILQQAVALNILKPVMCVGEEN